MSNIEVNLVEINLVEEIPVRFVVWEKDPELGSLEVINIVETNVQRYTWWLKALKEKYKNHPKDVQIDVMRGPTEKKDGQ